MSGWYSTLPVTKGNFKEVVRNFKSIIQDVLDPKHVRSVKTVKDYGQFASANISTKEIIVDEDYFYGEHEVLQPFTWNERLVIVTGTILHEVAHLRWSDKDGMEKIIPARHKRNKNASIVANIFEDIFVEDRLQDMFSYTKEFLSLKNQCLFPDSLIEDCRRHYDGKQPETEDETEKFLDLFVTWKRKEYPVTTVSLFERKIYDLLQSVKMKHRVEERSELVGQVLDLLPFFEEEKKEDTPKQVVAKGLEVYNAIDTKVALKVEEIVQSPTNKNAFLTFQNVTNSPSSLLTEIEDFREVSYIQDCKSAVRSVKGPLTYTGKKITNIAHYNQGNIFGVQTFEGNNSGKGKPEVVILVDFSGSMLVGIEGQPKTTKMSFALSCLGGLYNAFLDSGVPVACYGHSTTINKGLPTNVTGLQRPNPTIFTLSSFSKPLTKSGFHSKISAVLERALAIANGNADATAIIAMSRQFSRKVGDKILIVISDGLPAEVFPELDTSMGFKVGDKDILTYTKKVVDLVRGDGISVHSLSIDSKALTANNFIYGNDNNCLVLNKKQFVQQVIKSLN